MNRVQVMSKQADALFAAGQGKTAMAITQEKNDLLTNGYRPPIPFMGRNQRQRNERHPTKEQVKKLAEIFNQDESILLSENLSDQIAYKVIQEESDIAVLKVAEEKVNYLKKKKNG